MLFKQLKKSFYRLLNPLPKFVRLQSYGILDAPDVNKVTEPYLYGKTTFKCTKCNSTDVKIDHVFLTGRVDSSLWTIACNNCSNTLTINR